MTIRRRMFWSNIMMLVIPVVISIAISYTILFVFTRNSAVPMEKAFPSAYQVMTSFYRGGDEDELRSGVNDFNERFGDNGMYMAFVRRGEGIYPAELERIVRVEPHVFGTLFINEEITGTISVSGMRFTIEQYGEYRIMLVEHEHPPGGLDMRRRVLVHLPIIFLTVIAVILLTNRLLTYLLARRITRPLQLLAEGARQLGEGNLDHRIRYEGKDEFLPVCESFNEMAMQLQNLIRRQQKDEESRKELLAGISHDLRTPLTSIKAYVEGLLDGVAEDMSAQLRYLSIIRQKAEDIDQIVDKLFLFAKLDIEEFPLSMETVDIGDELRALALTVEEEYEPRGLTMTLEQSPRNIRVRVDAQYLHNVFFNILENSLRYKDKDRCVVAVRCFVQDDRAHIWMTDDGPGVREENLEKIFDVFYRGDPSRENPSKGSGLGLAISSRIMQRMGGAIRAQSAPEGGLRIMLELPVDTGQKEENGEADTNY